MPSQPMDSKTQLLYDARTTAVCAVDEGPLRGLRHRTVIDARTGSTSTALWQEEHLPGFRVPRHRHDCEEIIAVVEGRIRATIGEEEFEVAGGQSVLIPRWISHGFEVLGVEPVKLHAFFSSAMPGIFRDDGTPSSPPWEGGASGHLDSNL